MNESELSLLAFLAKAVISSPSTLVVERIQEQMRTRQPKKRNSKLFSDAVKIVGVAVNNASLRASRTPQRLRVLEVEAGKLSKKRGRAHKSAGEALRWALSKREQWSGLPDN